MRVNNCIKIIHLNFSHLHKQLLAYFENKTLPGEAAQELMAPSSRNPKSLNHHQSPTPSAVLILLYPKSGQWHFALIKRNSYKGSHSAQVSLPGGKMDSSDIDLQACALRETWEEIGVRIKAEAIVGELSSLYIPISNFMVHPFVAIIESTPHFKPDTHEVKHLIELPLKHIITETKIKYKEIISQGHNISTPVYSLEDDYIWGATAMILSEFAELVKTISEVREIID